MKKNNLFTLILSLILFFSFSACDLFMPEEDIIEITGQWFDSYGYGYSISASSFASLDAAGAASYECTIVEFNNDNFNAGDNGDADCGFAVIQYTSPPSWNSGIQNKFGIIRWQDLTASSMNFSEGYYDPTGTYNAVYFDTAEDAKTSMTNANACFNAYSAVEKQ